MQLPSTFLWETTERRMESKGMTAIIRGLPDSGLMVTLMDGGRQYTLMPQAEVKEPLSRSRNVSNNMLSRHSQYVTKDAVVARCDTGAQVADGRYASSYKIEYCHLRPTSPPVELTEFPPQRAELQPGHENFEVGGVGSGAHSPIRSNNTYIVSNRSDRGTASMTRDSIRSDAFTESLRKYPSLSPGSSEVVERLYSYSKEGSSWKSNRFKLNECISCYHATTDNTFRGSSRSIHPRLRRSQEETVTGVRSLSARSRNCKPNEDRDARLRKNLSRNVVRIKSGVHNIRPSSAGMQDSEVVSNDDAHIKSFQNVATSSSKFEDNEVSCITYEDTDGKVMRNSSSGSLQATYNIRSIQTSKSLLDECVTKKRKSLRRKRKMSSAIRARYHNIKHKSCLLIEMDKSELKSLRTEVVNLIKKLKVCERDVNLEEKIKMLLKRTLEDIIHPEQIKHNKETMLGYGLNDRCIPEAAHDNDTNYLCKNITTTEEPVVTIQNKFNIFWRNYLKRVSDTHRDIIEEMLRTATYDLIKDENVTLTFSGTNILKDILSNLGKNENNNFAQQNNNLEYRNRLHENIIRENKILCNTYKRRQARKYHRYLTSLRRLIKSETLHVINNSKRINKKSKNCGASSPLFQTKYVTNMLLNQYCAIKLKEGVYQQKTKNYNILTFKCLSDTYILLHDSSRNKAILTQSKIDRMNLQHGTKLLTSIKNKHTYESRTFRTENCYNIENFTNKHNARNITRRNDMSSIPITQTHTQDSELTELLPVLTSSIDINPSTAKISLTLPIESFQNNENVIKDIYSRVEFCDDYVSQVLVGSFVEKSKKNENNKKCATVASISNQVNYSRLSKSYKSGIINVAVASANENIVNHSCQGCKSSVIQHFDKPNQTENDKINMTDDVAQPSSSKSNGSKEISEGVTSQQLHEYNVEIFRNHCEQLPILAITPDLEELARVGVLHNILKIYYMLQDDPDIENDYTHFELCLEDEIDGLLDMLPQTEEMKRIREGWKIKLVIDAITLLKFKHRTTDSPEFKQKLDYTTNRRKILRESKREDEEAQQFNALRTAEEYLILSNYREQNPLIIKIYTQRLVDRINELYEALKNSQRTPFLKLPLDQLRDAIFRELNNVPQPNNNITKEEIDLVNMNDEVAKWYNGLPVQQTQGLNNIKRQILLQALAKKIHNMERHLDLDEPSVERNMRHEISMFLSNKAAGLETDEDLNINLMVEQLTNNLRTKRHEKVLNYDSFKKDLPFSSTIVRHDTFRDNDPSDNPHQNSHILNDNEEENIFLGSTNDELAKLKPIPRTRAKGILGISQIPGSSTRDSLFPTQVPTSTPRGPTKRYAPRTIPVISPKTSSLNDNDSKQFHEISSFGHISPTKNRHINSYQRASPKYPRQSQSANDQSVIGNTTKSNNFMHYDREEDPRLRSKGRTYGPSTAQVDSAYASDENHRDYRKTSLVDAKKRRDPNKIRCLCAENQLRSLRRYMCCCQDYISEHHCCLPSHDYFF